MKEFTEEQDERMNLKDDLIYNYYYDRGYQFGIKELYEILKADAPEYKISYRYVNRWLEKQTLYQQNQLVRQTVRSKPIQTIRKSALIQFDLIDF